MSSDRFIKLQQVMVNDVQIDSLFDTGASPNFVSKEVVQANRWPVFNPEKATVSVAVNKEQQLLTECCSLDVKIGGKTKRTSAYVLPVSNRPMIFGLPFIKRHASLLAQTGVWSILGSDDAVHLHEESNSNAVQINLMLVLELRK